MLQCHRTQLAKTVKHTGQLCLRVASTEYTAVLEPDMSVPRKAALLVMAKTRQPDPPFCCSALWWEWSPIHKHCTGAGGFHW